MRSMVQMIIYVTLYIYIYIYIYMYTYIYIYIYIVTQAGSDKESPVFCCRADIARSMAAESVSKQCVYLYIYTFFIVCFNRVCIYVYIYIYIYVYFYCL